MNIQLGTRLDEASNLDNLIAGKLLHLNGLNGVVGHPFDESRCTFMHQQLLYHFRKSCRWLHERKESHESPKSPTSLKDYIGKSLLLVTSGLAVLFSLPKKRYKKHVLHQGKHFSFLFSLFFMRRAAAFLRQTRIALSAAGSLTVFSLCRSTTALRGKDDRSLPLEAPWLTGCFSSSSI